MLPVVSAQPGAVPANFADVEATLEHVPGLMVRQKMFLSQVLCKFLEKRNRYTVSHWDHTTTSRTPTDDVFARMPRLLEAREDSSCCCRYTCRHKRELDIGIFPPNIADEQGFPADVSPLLRMHRPFRCSWLCPHPTEGCALWQPQELRVLHADGSLVGILQQDFRCYEYFCRCNQYVVANDGVGERRHVWRTHLCCCRPSPECTCGCTQCGNCFAPSCCNRSFSIDVLDADEANVVGSLEIVWPGWNCKGVAAAGFENYLLRFPENSTGNGRALILSGLFLQDYMFFEWRKNKK